MGGSIKGTFPHSNFSASKTASTSLVRSCFLGTEVLYGSSTLTPPPPCPVPAAPTAVVGVPKAPKADPVAPPKALGADVEPNAVVELKDVVPNAVV